MNSTLIVFVILYLLVTIGIGLLAARRVHGAKDYLVAGRSLPLYMNVATVFATWFGAEMVLSVSATFASGGLNAIPGDPFGATVCLVLAALLFSKLFYRLNLLTIGDFYKVRYGKSVEVLTSVAIVVSYLGWTSAQLTALGLVIHVLSGGAMTLNHAIIIGAAIVLVYTVFGGMWSVAFTDLFQTVIIVIGLSLVGDGRRLPGLCLWLDPAAGRVPAHDQRQGREDRHARHHPWRRRLPHHRGHPHLHCLRGPDGTPRTGPAFRLGRRPRDPAHPA